MTTVSVLLTEAKNKKNKTILTLRLNSKFDMFLNFSVYFKNIPLLIWHYTLEISKQPLPTPPPYCN